MLQRDLINEWVKPEFDSEIMHENEMVPAKNQCVCVCVGGGGEGGGGVCAACQK